MRNLASQMTKTFTNIQPELMIVIMERREALLYPEMKRVGDTVLGIPTQGHGMVLAAWALLGLAAALQKKEKGR